MPEIVWLACMSAVSLFAFWAGGRPERVVAAANLAAWVGTFLAYDRLRFGDVQLGVLLVDAAFLAVLVWVALTARRWWPLFAAAFQLLGLVIHLATELDSGIVLLTYLRGLMIWSYLVLAALALGASSAWRRRRAGLAV
jgi:hypothetical protein